MLDEIIDKAKRLLPDSLSYPGDEIHVSMLRIAKQAGMANTEIPTSNSTDEDENYCITLAFKKCKEPCGWLYDGVR